MENNEIKTPNAEVNNNEFDTTQDYIDTIAEIRRNSVDRKEHEKLQLAHKKLLDAYASGREIDVPKEEVVDVNELRKKLFNKDANLSNLDYVETSLKLRNALIEKGERDPFLPIGTHVSETTEMYDKAQAVADLLQDCVDFADGDSGVFTARYQSMVKDNIIPGRGRKR